MSQTAPTADKSATQRAKKSLVPPDERFWQRYSPHAELPLSGAASLALHLLLVGLMLLAAWLAYSVFRHSSRSLPVEAVRLDLGGGGGNPHGTGDGPNQGKPQEASGDKTEEGSTNPDPTETEKRPDLQVQPTTPEKPEFDDPIRLIQQSNTASSQAMQRLAEQKIHISLPDSPKPDSGHGKGGTGQGGGSGSGIGTGTGDKTGEGRGTLTQREKRMLRWSMLFDTRSGRDYLAQLQGLGAILAIPTDASGKDYKIIRDLSARPAKLENEDISKIQRIYWIDDKPESVRDVMTILGVPLQPSHFVAFMPEELEQKLFRLEKDRLGKGRSEDDILETRFKITRGKKGFEPSVIGQKLK